MQNNEIDFNLILKNIKSGQIWKHNNYNQWIYVIRVFGNGFYFLLKTIPEKWESRYPKYVVSSFSGLNDDIRLIEFENNHTLIGMAKFNIDDFFNIEKASQ